MNDRASFIEIITATFAPGESRLFALTGAYFEIIDATFPVDVTLSDYYGAQRGLMKAAEASFNLKGTDFSVIQITSASAQTIRFAYGTGEAGTRRAAGAVSIVGTVPVDLIAADVDAIRRPELPAAFWNNSAALSANVAVQIFAAASNTNGAILWSAQSVDTNASFNHQAFIARATAPAGPNDSEIILSAVNCAGLSTSFYQSCDLKIPQRIARGLGLFFISNLASLGGAAHRHCRYTLL